MSSKSGRIDTTGVRLRSSSKSKSARGKYSDLNLSGKFLIRHGIAVMPELTLRYTIALRALSLVSFAPRVQWFGLLLYLT